MQIGVSSDDLTSNYREKCERYTTDRNHAEVAYVIAVLVSVSSLWILSISCCVICAGTRLIHRNTLSSIRVNGSDIFEKCFGKFQEILHKKNSRKIFKISRNFFLENFEHFKKSQKLFWEILRNISEKLTRIITFWGTIWWQVKKI